MRCLAPMVDFRQLHLMFRSSYSRYKRVSRAHEPKWTHAHMLQSSGPVSTPCYANPAPHIHIAIFIHGDPLTLSQIFLRHTIPPFLVDDVRACHHDLHSDHDKQEHSHPGGGCRDNCIHSQRFPRYCWMLADLHLLPLMVSGKCSVRPPLMLSSDDWRSFICCR